MWVINDGKKDFLEFLRNFSVQFLLTTLFMILAYKLNRLIAVGDYLTSTIFFIPVFSLAAVVVLAAIANLKNFFSAFTQGTTSDFKSYRKNLSSKNKWQRIKSSFFYLVANCKVALIESALVVLGVYMTFIAGIIYSIAQVDTIVNSTVFHQN